jgi:serine/threonine protein kinase
MNKKPQLIGQGTYGCVFYPGISCKGKTEHIQYVTKVQKQTADTEKEEAIGKQMRQSNKRIKQYYDYFAPVISSCPLQIASIEKDDIRSCSVLQRVEEEPELANQFVSTKIRYVGKQTLKEHLLERLLIDTPTFFAHLLETQLYLLQGLEKLTKANIIHYDLKSNNVMFHEKIQNPILIDFGMSILMDKITPENYHQYFFDHYEKYPPWCFDVVLLSFLVKEDPDKQDQNNNHNTKTKITKDLHQQMTEIQKKFTEENPVNKHLSDKHKKALETNVTLPAVHQKKETAIKELLSQWHTWDTYSLNVIYYRFFKENMDTVDITAPAPFVDTYISILEQAITAPASTRPTPRQMREILLTYSKSIPKKEFLVWNQQMKQHQKKPEVIQKEKDSIQKEKEEDKKTENMLHEKKHAQHKHKHKQKHKH